MQASHFKNHVCVVCVLCPSPAEIDHLTSRPHSQADSQSINCVECDQCVSQSSPQPCANCPQHHTSDQCVPPPQLSANCPQHHTNTVRPVQLIERMESTVFYLNTQFDKPQHMLEDALPLSHMIHNDNVVVPCVVDVHAILVPQSLHVLC